MFDPRLWPVHEDEYVVRLSNRDASLVAVVDEIDYEWARQYTWGYCYSKLRERGKEKFYAKTTLPRSPDGTPRVRMFLHKAVLVRAVGKPPDYDHTIADHRNGDSLDCRRRNLRWATPSMNRINLCGAYPFDLFDFAKRGLLAPVV